MIIHRPLDHIFSARSQVAVLRVLLDSAHGLTGREVARQAGMNHQSCIKVGLEVKPRTLELVIGTFKLDLVPVMPAQPDLYAPPPLGRTVRVFLGPPDRPVTKEKIIEVPSDAEQPIGVTLFVKPEVRLTAGTELPLVVQDVDTEEQFAQRLKVRVNRDF